MCTFKIAIDGPAGVGKSSTACEVAKILGFSRIDSGSIYRAVTFLLIKKFGSDIDITRKNEIEIFLKDMNISIKNERIFSNEEDLSKNLRDEIVEKKVALIAKESYIRDIVKEIQIKAANTSKSGIIIDGRDIGTVILPNANLKIFLTAKDEVRAKRRYEEYVEKSSVNFDTILDEIKKRDYEDINRKTAPLKCAEDAIIIDNSDMTFQEQVEIIVDLVKKKMV
ncbi:cytidylate kinase [Hamiltosporidium magnivora]|uniref:(d)CMP kinase n=1 Tax=Hamiltosporidium magnivora TaxID=148818 RepID=A0A4Q9LL62_9MICR|nr:cytidylate kinase [Hamiltosporidium magnivora]